MQNEANTNNNETSRWVQHCFEIECAKCGGEALRDSRNQYVYSAYCPHCGKQMLNAESQ